PVSPGRGPRARDPHPARANALLAKPLTHASPRSGAVLTARGSVAYPRTVLHRRHEGANTERDFTVDDRYRAFRALAAALALAAGSGAAAQQPGAPTAEADSGT